MSGKGEKETSFIECLVLPRSCPGSLPVILHITQVYGVNVISNLDTRKLGLES